ncbi:hypothetical protein EXT62_04800 [Pectobacterium carotovorum subsp. carotovorum]|nr:hypothetical protein [Pectobacterium carotovorum]MCL6396220.1 hypothetical protein [Pectobacterium carotovorum subsp. carotovorum]
MENKKMTIGRDCDGNLLINNTEHGDLVITSYEIMPNDYDDLCKMEENKEVKIRLFNIKSKNFKEPFRLELSIKNDTTHEEFLLIKGGWIPCSYMKKNTLLFADRNVISKIKSRYFMNEKKGSAELDYFDSIFLNDNNLTLDLTFWVLESNKGEFPSTNVMDEQLNYAKSNLKRALPNVKIAEYPGGNTYYHNISSAIKNTTNQRMDLLFKAAPLINRQFTSETREAIVHEIFELVDECKLSRSDISVILIFLRITMNEKKNPAQGVIKDSQCYTLKKAYNTACDLGSIEWLINLIRKHEMENSHFNIAFITQDKALAKLGSLMLSQKNSSSDGDKISAKISFPMSIFSDSLQTLQLVKKYLSTD